MRLYPVTEDKKTQDTEDQKIKYIPIYTLEEIRSGISGVVLSELILDPSNPVYQDTSRLHEVVFNAQLFGRVVIVTENYIAYKNGVVQLIRNEEEEVPIDDEDDD